MHSHCANWQRLQNKHIHPLAKSSNGIGGSCICVCTVFCFLGFPFSLRLIFSFSPFCLSCLLWKGVSLWKSILCTRVIDILELPSHLSHVLRPARLLLDILLDGYHVCAETLVRCYSLVSDPSHRGDTQLSCIVLYWVQLGDTQLNSFSLGWAELQHIALCG